MVGRALRLQDVRIVYPFSALYKQKNLINNAENSGKKENGPCQNGKVGGLVTFEIA